jgi:DNA mismatch repair protein MutS2
MIISMFYPADLFEKLEFDKVLELLRRECITEMAQERILAIKPGTDFATIDRALRQVKELKQSLEKNDRFPLAHFSDYRPQIALLDKEGYTLQVETFQSILQVLLVMRDIFKYFQGQKKEIYPHLYAEVRAMRLDEDLISAINRVFDEKGNVRSDASPELATIRREMSSKQRDIDQRFRQIVADYRTKGFLSDSPESFRNNRRVLSVPAEHKRKIKGIIHDESDTGRTTFIEPDEIIEMNNDLFHLEQEEKREIFRIMRELSNVIRPYKLLLDQYIEVLIGFDVIYAKARIAVTMKANMPVLEQEPQIYWKKSYHPLLYLKNKDLGRKTIPFDLRLKDEHRILMLSGPNAGGKSVTMKTVGLQQLMVQSGLLVPTSEVSTFGIFKQFMADIGDQQSLEDDLSTYSSRLRNAKSFIEKANHETLVLIDEMGSGTDPKPGGSIAEAILRELNNRGIFGVCTTHYSNLKVFAFRNHGIVNGNMHFDKEHLSPTYELKVGRPGSSYAFEIAAKSGLKKSLIDYARMRTGSETAVDDILIELQREKQELEETLKDATEKQKMLERLIHTYDTMQTEVEIRRKKLKLDEKELEVRHRAEADQEIKKLIKELRTERSLEKAQEALVQLKTEREIKVEQVDTLHKQVVELETTHKVAQRPIVVGDHVRLRSGGSTGQVMQMNGNTVVVNMGLMQVTIPLKQLELAAAPLVQESFRPKLNLSDRPVFDQKLDIRGMSADEALTVLEKFVDHALLANAHQLHILHGKGNGVLRKLVKNKLREYGHYLNNVYHPAPELGGDGVTLVDM